MEGCKDLLENLSEVQMEAVKTIDEGLEIIAGAGVGKTGVVTRRIVNILASKPEILPENIVALTFTKRAAEELKLNKNYFPALGYGNAMHESVKNIHKAAIAGEVIDEVWLDIKGAAANIRRNHLPKKCDKENCGKCHFNYLCLSKTEKKVFEIG